MVRSVAPLIRGGCLCGAVRYTVEGEPLNVRVCHCGLCRKATGAAFYARAVFPRSAVTIEGETKGFLSSPDVRRSFCPTCGASLFAERISRPEFLGVTLGSLDDPDALPPASEIWTSSRVAWVGRLGELPSHAEFPPG